MEDLLLGFGIASIILGLIALRRWCSQEPMSDEEKKELDDEMRVW